MSERRRREREFSRILLMVAWGSPGRGTKSQKIFCLLRTKTKNGNCSQISALNTKLRAFYANRTREIVDFLRADGKKRKSFAIFRRFRLNLSVFNASAEGASEKLLYFTGEQHIASSFSNSNGRHLPPPADAHVLLRVS